MLSKYWVYKYLTNLSVCVYIFSRQSLQSSLSLSVSGLYLWERLDLFVVRVHTSMNRDIAQSLSLCFSLSSWPLAFTFTCPFRALFTLHLAHITGFYSACSICAPCCIFVFYFSFLFSVFVCLRLGHLIDGFAFLLVYPKLP